MGFFSRLFGKETEADEAEGEAKPKAATPAPSRDPRAARGRGRPDRPPLADAPPPERSLEDALQAREAGDAEGCRDVLREIDRGGGLRTVIRAAAAIEAGDERELRELMPTVAAEDPAWRLDLQTAAAAAAGEPAIAAELLDRAAQSGAPAWALAWTRALSTDADVARQGLVELLFQDSALARTVAARDLAVPHVEADRTAAERYASFAHGRDMIRRFGADVVARLLDRVARSR